LIFGKVRSPERGWKLIVAGELLNSAWEESSMADRWPPFDEAADGRNFLTAARPCHSDGAGKKSTEASHVVSLFTPGDAAALSVDGLIGSASGLDEATA
jgi:hypothetical protein